jgi:hypothetical protein
MIHKKGTRNILRNAMKHCGGCGVTRENSSLSFDGGVRVRELLSFFQKG